LRSAWAGHASVNWRQPMCVPPRNKLRIPCSCSFNVKARLVFLGGPRKKGMKFSVLVNVELKIKTQWRWAVWFLMSHLYVHIYIHTLFINILYVILLMEDILHQLVGSLSHYLQGFVHPRWCRSSSIDSIVHIYFWFGCRVVPCNRLQSKYLSTWQVIVGAGYVSWDASWRIAKRWINPFPSLKAHGHTWLSLAKHAGFPFTAGKISKLSTRSYKL